MFMVSTRREVPGENAILRRQSFALKHGRHLSTLQAKLGSHGRIFPLPSAAMSYCCGMLRLAFVEMIRDCTTPSF